MKYFEVKTKFPDLPELDQLYTDLMINFFRVEHLVQVYEGLREQHKKPHGAAWSYLSDVLRAAVVLCHATLEEGLRGLIFIKAEWSKDLLSQVPLLGTSAINRPSKYTLSDLLDHTDKKVEDLIDESVFEHLNRKSFNRIEDVTEALKLLGLKTKDFEQYFPHIQAMMLRRHNIAHTGDQNDKVGKGHHRIKPISASVVRDWNASVQAFFLSIPMQFLKLILLPNQGTHSIADSE